MKATRALEREPCIRKADVAGAMPAVLKLPPNLPRDEAYRRDFTWGAAARQLTGLPGGVLNIAYEAVDRHAEGPLKQHPALRVQLDIDSMDALNFFIRLHEKLGVEIPEADYPKLSTLNECVDYLVQKVS